jgi:hypothetical protein
VLLHLIKQQVNLHIKEQWAETNIEYYSFCEQKVSKQKKLF